MKAIILSAGRGTRLLPLTELIPKCLLPIGGRTVLGWQLWALEAAGVEEAVVVTGFGAREVEAELESNPTTKLRARAIFNPLYDCTDNLVSCLAARTAMDGDFLLLNGDTLIEPDIVRRMLAGAPALVSIAVVPKSSYDADDMKVRSTLGWVDHIGKDLPLDAVDGEAIGLSLYRGDGPAVFLDALEQVERQPDGGKRWYLSAVELLAQRRLVRTTGVDGLGYAEIDYPEDLVRAEELVSSWPQARRLSAAAVNLPNPA